MTICLKSAKFVLLATVFLSMLMAGSVFASNITIVATNIVCNSETDLPNWGNHGPDITATTASNFLSAHSSNCSAGNNWNFQWGYNGNVTNPGDNTGAAGAGWTTFGPTASGTASVVVPRRSGVDVWVREAWQSGYIPFTGENRNQTVSAELYCAEDVENYDNYDYVDSPEGGHTYYCLAFNVPSVPVSVCGDRNVTGSEQCDGGACCDSTTCQFKSSADICRAAADACDAAEYCTGAAESCPTDAFQPQDTSCADEYYCNGQEVCDGAGACSPGSAPDCSQYNADAIGVCNNVPDDDNNFTWDSRDAFTSACVEGGIDRSVGGYHCSTSEPITHTCSIETCGAACESEDTLSCIDQFNYNGTQSCLDSCQWDSTCVPTEFCGDGTINGNEFCDDGDNNGQPGYCNLECTGATPTTGSLIVRKFVVGGPKVAGDFAISIVGSEYDNSIPGNESGTTLSDLQPETYAVSESYDENYVPAFRGDCHQLSKSLESTSTAYVEVIVGQASECNVTNTFLDGTLTVYKHVLGGPKSASDFEISVNTEGPSFTFNGSESGTTIYPQPASYRIGEIDSTEGSYSAAYSGDCNQDGDFAYLTVAQRGIYTCNITNTYNNGTLIVTKHVVGGSLLASAFTMRVGGENFSQSQFAGNENGTMVFGIGNYSVSEDAQTNYVQTFAGDCNGTIAVGEVKWCNVTNTYNAPPTPPPGNGGGSNNGGGSGGAGGSPSGSSESHLTVPVGVCKDVVCNISVSRSLASTNSSSVITTTLENMGGIGCDLENFVFTDTIPSELASVDELIFSSQATQDGRKVSFTFPTFGSGESKTLSYTAPRWLIPSRISAFATPVLAAKQCAVPVVQPELNQTNPTIARGNLEQQTAPPTGQLQPLAEEQPPAEAPLAASLFGLDIPWQLLLLALGAFLLLLLLLAFFMRKKNAKQAKK